MSKSYDLKIYTKKGLTRINAAHGVKWAEYDFEQRKHIPERLPPKKSFKKSSPFKVTLTARLPKPTKIPEIVNSLGLNEIVELDQHLRLDISWNLDKDFKTNNVRFARKLLLDSINEHAEIIQKEFKYPRYF